MQICGVDFGLSVSSTELRRKISENGWRIEQVKFDSGKDRYVAKAVSTRGQELERAGKTERLALANMLLAVQKRQSSVHLGRWQVNFTGRLQAIAEAYAKAPTYTAKASEPFLTLAADCKRRADVLGRHLQIEIVNDPEPYKSPQKMVDDIRKRSKLIVSRAGAMGHPIWSEQEVIAYRICHDVLGYAAANAGWDWEGENEAFAHHVHLLPESAQMALFTEALAHSAYNTFYHAYGPHKIAVFPQFMNEAQRGENPHKGWHGIHPDDAPPPIQMPEYKRVVSMIDGPDEFHYATAYNPQYRDPNFHWQSSVTPIQGDNGMTIKQTYGDPLDIENGRANAALLARPWTQVQDPEFNQMLKSNYENGGDSFTDKEFEYLKQNLPDQYQQMRETISNAFRAVLLSPKTSLFANALHYQVISHGPNRVPAGTDDPFQYVKAVNEYRRRYNVERHEERFPGRGEESPSHLAWQKFMSPSQKTGTPGAFVRYVAEMKQLPLDQAQDMAQRIINEWTQQEEDRLMEDDERKAPDKQLYPFQYESKAAQNVADTLQAALAAHRKKQDYAWPEDAPAQLTAAKAQTGEEIQDSSQTQDIPNASGLPGPFRYPGVMYGAFIVISRIGPYLDDFLKAALEDVHNHDATGHHFRAAVLQRNIDGIGAKVTSFAWLLLQPLTSQLATLDTHMMNVMGSNEESPKPRDYYGWERAFRDRLNAMGYTEDTLPTGLGQWLIWDHERTGGGSHQDHAALAPFQPAPWESVDWHETEHGDPNWSQNQPWWAATQPYQDKALEQWEQTYAPKTPQKIHPYQGMPKWGLPPADIDATPSTPEGTFAKVAWTQMPAPYFVHPFTGEKIQGIPGQTIMDHATKTLGLSVPEIWQQLDLAEAGKV